MPPREALEFRCKFHTWLEDSGEPVDSLLCVKDVDEGNSVDFRLKEVMKFTWDWVSFASSSKKLSPHGIGELNPTLEVPEFEFLFKETLAFPDFITGEVTPGECTPGRGVDVDEKWLILRTPIKGVSSLSLLLWVSQVLWITTYSSFWQCNVCSGQACSCICTRLMK